MQTAVRLLSRRDHSRAELIRKLCQRRYSQSDIQHAVNECDRMGYLDDGRFAQGYVRQLRARGYGCLRIRQMLLSKGLSRELAETSIEGCSREQIQRQDCMNALLKKTKNHHAIENIEHFKARLFRFLQNRGFPPAVINDVLREP